MKIKLDEVEIAQIVKEWAMLTYRTKNVSVLYGFDMTPARLIKAELHDDDYVHPAKLNAVFMDVEVNLRDEDYGNATSVLAEEAIKKVRGTSNVEVGTEADLQPAQNNSGIPL